MRKIISSIDIGSNSVKLIVGEMFENRLHILSASKVDSHGIEKGKIVDEDAVVTSIEKAITDASNKIGIQIEKCILGLNMVDVKLAKSGYAIKIKNADHVITGEDIQELMNRCADGKVPKDYALVSVIPVEFTIDGDKVVKEPAGKVSENLGLKAVIISSPKDYVSTMLDLVNRAGLKVIDVVPNAVSDYYTYRTNETDNQVGALINLGSEVSTVSIFNRGILTNTTTFPLGGKNIIKDISFISRIDDKEAKAIYYDLVLANTRLANPNEYRIVANVDGEEIKLNQFDVSDIASSRLEEILNLSKKQINVLTKKKISYIIVTGGLTELRDFGLTVENQFGKDAEVGRLNLIGARDNSYSSAVGTLKFFDKRLELKDKEFSIFRERDLNDMNIMGHNLSTNNESLLGKVFGYFFDN